MSSFRFPAPFRPGPWVPASPVRRHAPPPAVTEPRSVTETDLLVAALKDHIFDLQVECDELRSELDATRDALTHAESVGLFGRMKPIRDSLA